MTANQHNELHRAAKARFMRRAIEVAYAGMNGGFGGPFGAVIVKDGRIIGEGHNRALADKDPTRHAEMVAIREACKAIGELDLSGAEIYVNGVPCPMCMGDIFWARIAKLYYACLPEDAATIGFHDQEFYVQLAKPLHERALPTERLEDLYGEARACYDAWPAPAHGRPRRLPAAVHRQNLGQGQGHHQGRLAQVLEPQALVGGVGVGLEDGARAGAV